MGDIKVHQHTNFEPYISRNGDIIGADMHTCLPLSNQSLLHFISIFYLNKGENIFPGIYRLILHPYLPSKSCNFLFKCL